MATARRRPSTALRLESTFAPGSAREPSKANGRRQGAATANGGTAQKLRQHRVPPAREIEPPCLGLPLDAFGGATTKRVSGVVLGDYPRATIKEILTVARGPASGVIS